MFRRFIAPLAAMLLPIATAPAADGQYRLGPLSIGHPWSRATAAGMPMGVAYLSVTNHGAAADTLIAASSPVAARAEFHQTSLTGGVARMRPLPAVTIPAGSTVNIEPGGIHIMLVDLKTPLLAGKTAPLELTFRQAGAITVQLSIE